MTATINEAYDDILLTFRTAWLANADSAGIPVKYPDVAQDDFPPAGVDANNNPLPWVRVSVLHNPGAGGQSTLSGEVGQRRFSRFGILTVNIFTPSGGGRVLSQTLQQIAMRAFEGVRTAGTGVVFLRVRPVEAGPDGIYDLNNVIVDFEYDEVR